MKKRRLTEEDKALWDRVSATTQRLQVPRHKPEDKPTLTLPRSVEKSPTQLQPFKLGSRARAPSKSHDLAPSISDRVAAQPVQMDKKAFGRMKRGKLLPEARIDLHGMTLEQAHPALIGFVMRSYGEGMRLVLVITGKGKSKRDDGPIPERRGVLKHQVPGWLQMAPLRQVVLQVTEAHLKHGGSGAYYVYLRRPR
ncbi:Smr/MutS family protein [Cognatishimia sp. SS12]|uniref:Smr/MutS family protein n=1 Tax=Cognatishimia sp. SS12 TaxID=2979465 RepID=UPI00232BCCC0|nr:Smr/MutS family protein [Cognatishimia sp. SS12]MDC0737750.1 Smr/MutS family protein [Cognatishimia sp. SS12]